MRDRHFWREEGRVSEIEKKNKETGGLLSAFANLTPEHHVIVLDKIRALRQDGADMKVLLRESRALVGQLLHRENDSFQQVPSGQLVKEDRKALSRREYEKLLADLDAEFNKNEVDQYWQLQQLLEWAEDEIAPHFDKKVENESIKAGKKETFGAVRKRYRNDSHGKRGRDAYKTVDR